MSLGEATPQYFARVQEEERAESPIGRYRTTIRAEAGFAPATRTGRASSSTGHPHGVEKLQHSAEHRLFDDSWLNGLLEQGPVYSPKIESEFKLSMAEMRMVDDRDPLLRPDRGVDEMRRRAAVLRAELDRTGFLDSPGQSIQT